MFDLATEAMQPQIQSKLGTELDKLWQTVIEYRDTQMTDISKFQNRYLALKNFFDKNIARKFQDLVWKYVGLNISEVRHTTPWEGGFATCIRIGYEGGNNNSFAIGNVLSGGWEAKYWGIEAPNEMKSADLIRLVSSYDKMTGSINTQQREAIRKLVSCKIAFDLCTAFMIEDFLPENSGVDNMKPREVTAIVLHEIGHTMVLIEHACDMYARAASFNYLLGIYEARRSSDPREISKFAKNVADFTEKNANKEAAKKLRAVANKFDLDIIEAGNAADPHTLRNLTVGLVESAGAVLFDIVFAIMDILTFDSNGRFAGGDQKFKTSDLPVNSRLLTWQERKADEYAFAHGYGADQVSALNRLDHWHSRLGMTKAQCDKLTVAERIGKDISFFDKMKIAIFAVGLCSGFEYSLYPDNKQRLKELLNLSIQSLKNNGASADMVKKQMKDVETILDHIEHCDKYELFAARVAKAYDVFMSYISIPSLVDMLVHGKINRELEALIDDLQVLNGNLISYFGLKLQQLANKG